MPINRLTIESAAVTGTHTSTPVAVGTITGDYTIKLFVSAMTLANARIQIEESADSFSTAKPLVVWNFQGPVPLEGLEVSFRKREAAGSDLFGTAGAEARVNVVELNGYAPVSATYDAWIEY